MTLQGLGVQRHEPFTVRQSLYACSICCLLFSKSPVLYVCMDAQGRVVYHAEEFVLADGQVLLGQQQLPLPGRLVAPATT